MHRGGEVDRVKQLREQLNQADKNVLKPVHEQRAFSLILCFTILHILWLYVQYNRSSV